MFVQMRLKDILLVTRGKIFTDNLGKSSFQTAWITPEYIC